MEVMYPRCAGLDVHKETVVACVRIASDSEASASVRTFTTTTAGLIELGEWLEENGPDVDLRTPLRLPET